jgi:uncharacterized membrane protein
VIQPLPGFLLMHLAGGVPWATRWIAWSLSLYAIAIACCRDLSMGAAGRAGVWALFPVVGGLGCLAFVAFVAIFSLMVAKQLLLKAMQR